MSGVAIGLPVIVDFYRGKALGSNGKYIDAHEVDLQSWGQESLGLPLFVENDARMALLGEAYAGAGRGFRDIVMITLGTGIGGVAMIDGKLLRGKHAQAVAARVVTKVFDQVDNLATFPHIGRAGRVPNTRELVVVETPYIVPYRVRDNEIEILAVFHSARQWPENFH